MRCFFVTICVCIFLLLFSCQREDIEDHMLHARRIIIKIEKVALKKYGLVLYGQGGAFRKKINKINLSFAEKDEKSINEIRLLMVNLITDFLDEINSDAQLKQYLAEYPFGSDRLILSILVYDKNRKPIINKGSSKERLTSVFFKNNKLIFSVLNENKPYYQRVHEETLQQALEIVQEKAVH